VAEFLIAVIAVFVLWEEVGGQNHLDMIPWYTKLALGGGTAFAAVKATAAAVERDRAWNSRTVRWTGILLALLLACGLVTYYYHLFEYEDDEEEEPNVSSAATVVNASLYFRGPR
jgi:hypothetical protein